MSILSAVAPASKPTAGLDPWTERPAYDVERAALAFGARVKSRTLPGVFKVVRAAERRDSTCRYTIRVREIAANGSLVGPVLNWRVDEVAELVTVEPKPAPAPVAPPADEPRPLVVAMAISIDHVHYAVSPLAPAPGATKAYRFTKVDGDGAQHDLDETADGASCSCGDFTWRHEGRDDLGCKHLRAARMLGLIAEAPEPTPARTAYDDAREKLARLAAAEAVVRREGAGDDANPARDIVLIDDDGQPLETPAEMARRHREEHAVEVAELMEGNPFLPACCPSEEPTPCRACLGPADASDDSWDDEHCWAPCDFAPDADPDDDEPFAAWLDLQAEAFATIGTPGASWLAGRIARLAEQARWLDAASPATFDDRLQAQLDAARDAAEARMASRCC